MRKLASIILNIFVYLTHPLYVTSLLSLPHPPLFHDWSPFSSCSVSGPTLCHPSYGWPQINSTMASIHFSFQFEYIICAHCSKFKRCESMCNEKSVSLPLLPSHSQVPLPEVTEVSSSFFLFLFFLKLYFSFFLFQMVYVSAPKHTHTHKHTIFMHIVAHFLHWPVLCFSHSTIYLGACSYQYHRATTFLLIVV